VTFPTWEVGNNQQQQKGVIMMDLLAEMDELLGSDTAALDRVDVAVERVTGSVFLPVFLSAGVL